MLNNLINNLQCLNCHAGLILSENNLHCKHCAKIYKIQDSTVFFIPHLLAEERNALKTGKHSSSQSGQSKAQFENSYKPQYNQPKGVGFIGSKSPEVEDDEKSDALIYKLKNLIKKSPRAFFIINHLIGLHTGKSAKAAIKNLPNSSFIVNLGSGVNVIRKDVINVDEFPYPGVRIIADVHNLPFKDSSADAVIAENLLEHINQTEAVINEIYRVLKPGGLVYLSVPFIIPYHSSFDDFQRWTVSGLRKLMTDFKELDLGIRVGPTGALTYLLREWLALLLSFNSKILFQFWTIVFMAVLFPLNLLDLIVNRYKSAQNLAHIYYYIGRKI